MRLDAKAFGMAGGAAAAVLFVVCAVAVAIAPGSTTAFAGYLIHADLSGLARTLTWGSFMGGLLAWTLGASVTFWLGAVIYNGLTGAAAERALPEPRPLARSV